LYHEALNRSAGFQPALFTHAARAGWRPALRTSLVICLLAAPAVAAPRVYSLDQCADQYVLALSPRAAIVGLSRRAANRDAYLAAEAGDLPRRRATTEAVLGARPDVVVRYWGGDDRLAADLGRRGIRVVKIADATDFAGVRNNIIRVAAALGRPAAGAGLIGRMDGQLAAASGAGRGARALYLTTGGYTAGPDTLVDAMMSAAGLNNLAAGRGFHPVRLESLVLRPPSAMVLGFFDGALDGFQRWSLGRHQVLRRVADGRTLVSLPGAILGCPAWFAADGAARIARAVR